MNGNITGIYDRRKKGVTETGPSESVGMFAHSTPALKEQRFSQQHSWITPTLDFLLQIILESKHAINHFQAIARRWISVKQKEQQNSALSGWQQEIREKSLALVPLPAIPPLPTFPATTFPECSTTQRGNGEGRTFVVWVKGLCVFGRGLREGVEGGGCGVIYLTDLCQVWCQRGWRMRPAPGQSSDHRAYRTAWPCRHGNGCRYRGRRSSLPGTTPVARGSGYLVRRGHDPAQYLLMIHNIILYEGYII